MRIDVKSLLIGALLVVTVFLSSGAIGGAGAGKYQIQSAGGDGLKIAIINTATGKFAIFLPYDKGWKPVKGLVGIIPEEMR